ncbi:MAG: peptidoglycan-binding protein [Deltaproteobacteria bacterium]|nr:peptidoglycan-binding protein [Deltaproteobacteria bacterium]
MAAYTSHLGGETLRDLHLKLYPNMEFEAFRTKVQELNPGPLKVFGDGALEPGQNLKLPDSLSIKSRPDDIVSSALSGRVNQMTAQQAGQIRINPATGKPTTATGTAEPSADAATTNVRADGKRVNANGQPAEWVPAVAGKPIEFGMQGPEVRTQQERLTKLGFVEEKFGDDGKHGRFNEERVKRFQAKHGLEQTGAYDTATLNKMTELEAKAAPAATPEVKKDAPAATPEVKKDAPAAAAAKTEPNGAPRRADPAIAAAETKAAAPAKPPRDLGTIDGDISAKKAEIRALGGAPDSASQQLRSKRIGEMETELRRGQAELQGTDQFKQVQALREKQAVLKDREGFSFSSDADGSRGREILALRKEIAAGEQAVKPFINDVTAKEAKLKELEADVRALKFPYDSRQATARRDGIVARSQGDLAALEAEFKAHPGSAALVDYRANLETLKRLEGQRAELFTGGAKAADREEQISSLRAKIDAYVASHTP